MGETYPYVIDFLLNFAAEPPHSHKLIYRNNSQSDLVCEDCGLVFYASTASKQKFDCPATESIHHFHRREELEDSSITWACCKCDFRFNVIAKNSVIPLKLLDTPNSDCLNLVLQYLENLMNGNNQSIRMANPNFEKRVIPYGGVPIMKLLGFTELEGYLIPPSMEIQGDQVNLAIEQIKRKVFSKKTFDEKVYITLCNDLGGKEPYPKFPLAQKQSYKKLGVADSFRDSLIFHVVTLLLKEKTYPANEIVSILEDISEERSSDYLKSQILSLQRESIQDLTNLDIVSTGFISKCYRLIDASLASSDEEILLKYSLKISNNFNSELTNAMRTIAIHRGSKYLMEQLGFK